MKKQLLFSVLSFFLAISMYAQNGFHKIGVGAEVALPMGNFGDAYNIGFGVTGKVYYALNEEADITGTLGYLHFGLDTGSSDITGNISMIPIMFGYRHNFNGFYAEPQVGFVALSSKVKMSGMFSGFNGTTSSTEVSLSLGGGYAMDEWDFGLRYQIVNEANFVAARVAYNFSI